MPDEDDDAHADTTWSEEYIRYLIEEMARGTEMGRAIAALRPNP